MCGWRSRLRVGGAAFVVLWTASVYGESALVAQGRGPAGPRPAPPCAGEQAPFRDLDFLIGEWDFVGADGQKLGEHTYFKREQGCLILEEWTSASGSTGTGMNFVDPATGLWRQVWMSPLFHIDYSGALDKEGTLVLEGRIHPHSGESGAIRGVWTRQADGSIRQEFLRFDEKTRTWDVFFAGVSRRKR